MTIEAPHGAILPKIVFGHPAFVGKHPIYSPHILPTNAVPAHGEPFKGPLKKPFPEHNAENSLDLSIEWDPLYEPLRLVVCPISS